MGTICAQFHKSKSSLFRNPRVKYYETFCFITQIRSLLCLDLSKFVYGFIIPSQCSNQSCY
jgi:hypothetical protein